VSGQAEAFLDTNVLVYAFTSDPRSVAAQDLLARGCVVGVQTLNEFANVARRKLAMTWPELDDALSSLRAACARVVPLDLAIHQDALRIARRYGFAIFDSLMISAALSANCTKLWSEDMRHGLLIDDRLKILDPFRQR